MTGEPDTVEQDAPPLMHASIATPLGMMRAAATEAGICLLQFESAGGMPAPIPTQPSSAAAERHLESLAREIAAYFEGRLKHFEVTVAPLGSPFEQRVWTVLRAIPYGHTRTYHDIARDLSQMGASRAVGRANGRNPIAIVIPCHRVLRADGALGGYAGETWRKQALLALEGACLL